MDEWSCEVAVCGTLFGRNEFRYEPPSSTSARVVVSLVRPGVEKELSEASWFLFVGKAPKDISLRVVKLCGHWLSALFGTALTFLLDCSESGWNERPLDAGAAGVPDSLRLLRTREAYPCAQGSSSGPKDGVRVCCSFSGRRCADSELIGVWITGVTATFRAGRLIDTLGMYACNSFGPNGSFIEDASCCFATALK